MNDALFSLAGGPSGKVPAGNPLSADAALVNLGEVMQYELLVRQPLMQQLQAIVRFDALPQVAGTQPQMARLFQLMLDSIVHHPPAGTKLLLYLKCERVATDILDLSLPEGFQQFGLSVFTNIIANEAWQLQQQAALAEMENLVLQAKGSFSFSAIVKTGCLYQVQLPGKPV